MASCRLLLLRLCLAVLAEKDHHSIYSANSGQSVYRAWIPIHYIRSDGGPQFRSEFDEYCKKNSIKHELSSPYNPESNGLAESAVKNLKSIILRCKDAGEDIKSAIAAWRNMVRADDGSSPSQMFFGRTQKQKLPMLNPNATSFNPDTLIQKRDVLHSKRCNLRDQHLVVIADLVPCEKLLVQDYLTGLWTDSATVLSIREDKRTGRDPNPQGYHLSANCSRPNGHPFPLAHYCQACV